MEATLIQTVSTLSQVIENLMKQNSQLQTELKEAQEGVEFTQSRLRQDRWKHEETLKKYKELYGDLNDSSLDFKNKYSDSIFALQQVNSEFVRQNNELWERIRREDKERRP